MRARTADDLAQNFAALRALATHGRAAGHMRLHSRNVACEAGATGAEGAALAERMVDAGAAKNFLQQMRCEMQ
jgi:hydroxymethylglutaryl-CoA reductase